MTTEKPRTKIKMSGHWYSFTDDLTDIEEEFFGLVEKCDLPAIVEFLKNNNVNINIQNYQGITPLHLAIQSGCEPLVDLFLSQKDVQIADSMLYAISNNRISLLERLMEYSDHSRAGGSRTDHVAATHPNAGSAYEFPPFMTPLMLAAQCGRYETVEYLLGRGHRVTKPHPPRCTCKELCEPPDVLRKDPVAEGCERLNAYKAISDPTYVCCTSAADPILTCFQLHDELLECGSVDQVYKTKYKQMAQQVRQCAVQLASSCRDTDEVKLLLGNPDGCRFKGEFLYPRLITAMDHKQKEFVAQANVQQVLESAWIGDWVEWKTYSGFRKTLYPFWRFTMLPLMVLLGVLLPTSSLNRINRLPINRMINCMITYFVFLGLLFYQSNADKYKTRRGAPDSIAWVLICVFVAGHVVDKIRLRTMQGPERFFGNSWNVFDTIKLTLFTGAYLCWSLAAFQAVFVDDDVARKFWHWADPQLVAEALFAVATVMAYMRLLFLCQLNYHIGPMQVSLGKMSHDIGKFLVFIGVIMVAFTSGMGTLYSYYRGMVHKDPETGEETRQEDSFVSVPDTLRTLFWGIFCMSSLESTDVVVANAAVNKTSAVAADALQETQHPYFTQLVGYVLFAVYVVLMVVVMLNMLIGAMSDTYQRVADNADYEWLFGRTRVYVEYMLMDGMPPPFNLLPTVQSVTPLKNLLFKSKKPGYEKLLIEGSSSHHSKTPGASQPEFRALMAKLIKRYFIHAKNKTADDE